MDVSMETMVNLTISRSEAVKMVSEINDVLYQKVKNKEDMNSISSLSNLKDEIIMSGVLNEI